MASAYKGFCLQPCLVQNLISCYRVEGEYNTADEPLIYSEVEERDGKEEPLYLPMTPVRQKEDTYVVMANLVNQNNQTSEPVT